MLMIHFFPRIDKRFARLAASVLLLALSQLPLAQAGERVPPLPPGTITVEDTHYQPVAPGSTAPTRQQILEKALAGPVTPKETPKPGETTMEEITRPDGQRVTKVTGPNGTYCVTQISVGNTKGEDIMQKGAVSRTTSCGAPF
ncbi:hypothetical protein [Collimonas antrihumi]|uniref:hypothetical protein n=1 Tax=Collimonas antrihumi TaxID=1940615 RepID=UPI001B8AF2B1|nr:hypothetical protein [Collimonas antrihumi]